MLACVQSICSLDTNPDKSSWTKSEDTYVVSVSVVVIVRVSPDIVVVTLVPPAIFNVFPGIIAVEPESPEIPKADTIKSISPFMSSYAIAIPFFVPPNAIRLPA